MSKPACPHSAKPLFKIPTSAYTEKELKSWRNWFGLRLIACLPSFYSLFFILLSSLPTLFSLSWEMLQTSVSMYKCAEDKKTTKKQQIQGKLKLPVCHFLFNWALVLHLYYRFRVYRNWRSDKKCNIWISLKQLSQKYNSFSMTEWVFAGLELNLRQLGYDERIITSGDTKST